MASIADKIAQIRQAVFGKDIRENLAQGIESINAEVESTTQRQTELEDNMAEAEVTRTTAEQLRVTNETARESSETTRQENEAARIQRMMELEGVDAVQFDGRLNTINESLNDIVNVKRFGAKGDGVTDDRAAIQSAIDSLPSTGGTIIFPATSAFYAISSSHPTQVGYGLVIDKPNVVLLALANGSVANNTIKLTANISNAAILLTANAKGFKCENVFINCNHNTNYGFYTTDFVSGIYMENTKVMYANLDGFYLITYLTNLVRCDAWYCGRDGFSISGKQGAAQGTSTKLDNCYSDGSGRYGYNLYLMTYSGLYNCACDGAVTAGYYLDTTRGITLQGCGSETTQNPIQLNAAHYTTISNFSMVTLHPTLTTTALIDILTATAHVTISEIYLNSGTPTYYLRVCGYSSDIVILDNTITRDLVNEIAGGNTKKILYLAASIQTPTTVNITPSDFLSNVQKYNEYKLDYDVTIQISDGVMPYSETGARTIQNIDGHGHLIFQGNAADKNAVVIDAGDGIFNILNNKATIIFRNLTFYCAVGSDAYSIFTIKNSNVIFDNCILRTHAGYSTGTAITASDNVKVSFINGTGCIGLFTVQLFNVDKSSQIQFDTKGYSPYDGLWDVGCKFENQYPVAAGYSGWVCTTKGAIYTPYWQATTAYSVGNVVKTSLGLYYCITAGTSGSTAPTGTGSNITDGTAHWKYLSQPCYQNWQPNTTYALDNVVITSAGIVYICVTAGTSSSTAPSSYGGAVSDGTVSWRSGTAPGVIKGYGTIQT